MPVERPGFAAVALGQARERLRRVDLANALIGFADAIEAGFGKLFRLLRGQIGRWRAGRSGVDGPNLSRPNLGRLNFTGLGLPGLNLGITGGLLWRCLAALTGIGLTTALVTAISEAGSEPTLASLTLQPVQEIRPIRDVRQDPRSNPGTDDSWVRISRPVAMFGLEAPELERQPAVYEARRSQSGSRRQDGLAFGGFTEAKPHLELRLLVEHGVAPAPQPFVIALVREAAERGMSVQRSGTPTAIETRFGPVETADATLSDGESSRACIAFRKGPGEMPLGLSGWWCGGSRPADRQQLVCLIDRINLLSAGDDPALRTAFSRSELARQPGCAPPRLSASGRKASWLDADGQAPALKTVARR